MTEYGHHELAERLNLAFTALREEAQTDNEVRYGTDCTDGGRSWCRKDRTPCR